MAYIPQKHQKYEVLPRCRKGGGEVFNYPGNLLRQLNQYLPEGYHMMPYGYDSYEAYFAEMDRYAENYFQEDEPARLYEKFKEAMCRMNRKEDWSILRYVGESSEELFSLTHNHIYYWPCSAENPTYEGVIDDEEFTSYLYSTEPEDWEILEDPTGMAYRTLYGRKRGYMSRKQYDDLKKQLEKMAEEL